MTKPKKLRISKAQVAVVLSAVADLEGWDSKHNSVKTEKEGDWSSHP